MIQKRSSGKLLPSPAQLRAARGLIGWSQTDLAKKADLSLPTVKRVETDWGIRVSEDARSKLRDALEAGGVEFIAENDGTKAKKGPRPVARSSDRR